MWLFNRKSINPKDNPRKWIKKHYVSPRHIEFCVGANTVYKDNNNRTVDMSKFLQLYVQGNKMEACNIHDGDIVLCSTYEYLESIHAIQNNPIGIFSDGQMCQIAFMGDYNTPFEEVWQKCCNCKSEYSINKEKETLKEEIALLIYDKDFESDYIIGFKYLDNHRKEWYIYFRSELVGIVKYAYKVRK